MKDESVTDDLLIRADHDTAMARMLVSLERSLEIPATPSGIMIEKRCPKCNCSLITDGEFMWCSFIGGSDERACDYGISTPVQAELPVYRQSEFINSDNVCVKIDGETFVSQSVLRRLSNAKLEERDAIAGSLQVLDVSNFSMLASLK